MSVCGLLCEERILSHFSLTLRRMSSWRYRTIADPFSSLHLTYSTCTQTAAEAKQRKSRVARAWEHIRFDFFGVILPPTADVSTDLALHHHGDDVCVRRDGVFGLICIE